jgi:hypothetical protein
LLGLSASLVQAVELNLCYVWLQEDDAAYIRDIIRLPAQQIMDVTVEQDADKGAGWAATSHCRLDSWDPWDSVRGTQLLQDYFVSTGRLLCNTSTDRPELGPEGVVMHMRSGDIMQYNTDSGLDPQPPCNFYTKVLEEGNNGTAFKHALIVTQPDFRNPCISLVHKRFPKLVTVQSHSINEDACMIATAQNVVTAAYSTWDVALTRLNVNLKNLYVPMGKDDGTDYYIGSIWGVWQNSDYPNG